MASGSSAVRGHAGCGAAVTSIPALSRAARNAAAAPPSRPESPRQPQCGRPRHEVREIPRSHPGAHHPRSNAPVSPTTRPVTRRTPASARSLGETRRGPSSSSVGSPPPTSQRSPSDGHRRALGRPSRPRCGTGSPTEQVERGHRGEELLVGREHPWRRSVDIGRRCSCRIRSQPRRRDPRSPRRSRRPTLPSAGENAGSERGRGDGGGGRRLGGVVNRHVTRGPTCDRDLWRRSPTCSRPPGRA